MRFQYPSCPRDFTRCAALCNHIKTHSSTLERILQEIAEEREQNNAIFTVNNENQLEMEEEVEDQLEQSIHGHEQPEVEEIVEQAKVNNKDQPLIYDKDQLSIYDENQLSIYDED